MPKKLGMTAIMFTNHGLKDPQYVDIAADSWNGVTVDIQKVPAGDFDHTGTVDLRDLILVLQVLIKDLPDEAFADGDVDGDGKIGIGDAVYVLQYTAELR